MVPPAGQYSAARSKPGTAGSDDGMRAVCSAREISSRSANIRALSIASAACAPNSSASAMSAADRVRPCSVHSSVIAPSIRPRARSGTVITERSSSDRTTVHQVRVEAGLVQDLVRDLRHLRLAGADRPP